MTEYPALAINQVDARNFSRGRNDRVMGELNRLRLASAQQGMQDRNVLRAHLPGAYRGNTDDLAEVGAVNPEMAASVQKHLASMGASKREQAYKEAKLLGKVLANVRDARDWEIARKDAANFDASNGTNFSKVMNQPYSEQTVQFYRSLADETVKVAEGFTVDPENPGAQKYIAGGKADPEYIAKVEEAKEMAKAKGTKDPSAIREIEALQAKMKDVPEGSEAHTIYRSRLHKLTSAMPTATVNVNTKGMSKEQEKLAEMRVKRYEKAVEDQASARDILDSIEQFQAGMEGFETGAFGESRAALAVAASFVGMDPKEMGLGDASSAQAIQSAANKMALRFRNMGGGMPGQMSDRDVKFLVDAVASIGKTPEANRVIMAFMQRAAERSISLASGMEGYLTENETLKGFKFAGGRHVFSGEDRKVLKAALRGAKEAPAGDDPLGLFTKDNTI